VCVGGGGEASFVPESSLNTCNGVGAQRLMTASSFPGTEAVQGGLGCGRWYSCYTTAEANLAIETDLLFPVMYIEFRGSKQAIC
jgi:hypothetical protein